MDEYDYNYYTLLTPVGRWDFVPEDGERYLPEDELALLTSGVLNVYAPGTRGGVWRIPGSSVLGWRWEGND